VHCSCLGKFEVSKTIMGEISFLHIRTNSLLKNEFYKGCFGARVPGVENDPLGSFLWDECANALIKRVFYVIF
jgi:hypothetical protein